MIENLEVHCFPIGFYNVSKSYNSELFAILNRAKGIAKEPAICFKGKTDELMILYMNAIKQPATLQKPTVCRTAVGTINYHTKHTLLTTFFRLIDSKLKLSIISNNCTIDFILPDSNNNFNKSLSSPTSKIILENGSMDMSSFKEIPQEKSINLV